MQTSELSTGCAACGNPERAPLAPSGAGRGERVGGSVGAAILGSGGQRATPGSVRGRSMRAASAREPCSETTSSPSLGSGLNAPSTGRVTISVGIRRTGRRSHRPGPARHLRHRAGVAARDAALRCRRGGRRMGAVRGGGESSIARIRRATLQTCNRGAPPARVLPAHPVGHRWPFYRLAPAAPRRRPPTPGRATAQRRQDQAVARLSRPFDQGAGWRPMPLGGIPCRGCASIFGASALVHPD